MNNSCLIHKRVSNNATIISFLQFAIERMQCSMTDVMTSFNLSNFQPSKSPVVVAAASNTRSLTPKTDTISHLDNTHCNLEETSP